MKQVWSSFPCFFLLKWCMFKWQVLFVILKGKVRRTPMQMLISRKTVGPFIVSKGPPMRMVWGSQGPSKSCYKWKPWCLLQFNLHRTKPGALRVLHRVGQCPFVRDCVQGNLTNRRPERFVWLAHGLWYSAEGIWNTRRPLPDRWRQPGWTLAGWIRNQTVEYNITQTTDYL